jgi:hypothetical protein
MLSIKRGDGSVLFGVARERETLCEHMPSLIQLGCEKLKYAPPLG